MDYDSGADTGSLYNCQRVSGSFLILCEMREVKTLLNKIFFRGNAIDDFDTLIYFTM